jgi:hypothetical protein
MHGVKTKCRTLIGQFFGIFVTISLVHSKVKSIEVQGKIRHP